MVPNGWTKAALDNLVKIVDSLHRTPKFSPEGYSMVRVTDLKGGRLSLENSVKVSKEVFEEFTRNHRPRRGDIIFSRVGSFGVPAYVDTDEPFCLGQNTIVISPSDTIVSKFLYNVFLSSNIQTEFMRIVDGSSQKTLSLKTIRSIEIPVPPKSEQEKIAQILSTWDAAIEKVSQLIDRKILRRTLFIEDIFTKNSSMGIESWTEMKIAELCELNPENVSKKEPDFFYIDLSSVSSGRIYYPEETIGIGNAPSRAKRKCKKGDILVSNVRPNLKGFAVIESDLSNLVASTGFSILRSKDSSFSQLVYSSFYSTHVANQISAVVTGSSYPAMNTGDVGNFSIRVPKSASDASRLGNYLESTEREILLIQAIKSSLLHQKQALMQQLLTGKKRVAV